MLLLPQFSIFGSEIFRACSEGHFSVKILHRIWNFDLLIFLLSFYQKVDTNLGKMSIENQQIKIYKIVPILNRKMAF